MSMTLSDYCLGQIYKAFSRTPPRKLKIWAICLLATTFIESKKSPDPDRRIRLINRLRLSNELLGRTKQTRRYENLLLELHKAKKET